jgi:diguanylate cyclase (GGDEF)-like protein
LLGKTPSEIPGGAYAENYEQKIRMAFANGETSEFELKWSNRAGREMCSLVRVVAERDASGKIVSVLTIGRDITELHEQREQMHHLVFYDALTALPNRASFSELLQRRIAEAARHGQLIGVMLLDLDCFKSVNDTLGHSAGDTLLRETALRLGQCVRAYDTLARLGGDEFAILLPAVHARDELISIADRILEALAPAFMLDNREVFISASIGIALYPEHGKNTDELLKQADVAMYAAKRAGRGNFRFYARELAARNGEKLNLESELRHGLARGELELYYQPKIRLLDGALIGAEALLRWNHPRRGMVLPNTFIPIAEERGLITDIGEWVLRDGCRAAYEWNAPGKPLLKVAVNLSARQFLARNLATHVQRILEETGCPPGWLELEITESLLLEEDGEVRKTLDAFREMGITVAIDDFGTGYSALNYLARFPIDTLKIDRSFISRIGEGEHHAELVKAIILIAHSLKQKVVAEGVETTEQADFLRTQGCHCAQGYLYSQPLSKSAFAALRERANGRAAARAPATAGYLLLAGQDEQNFH